MLSPYCPCIMFNVDHTSYLCGPEMCLAIPARVVSVHGSAVTLDVRGRRVEADGSLVPVKSGDFVLVQAGLILQVLDRADAEERLALLAEVLDDGTA